MSETKATTETKVTRTSSDDEFDNNPALKGISDGQTSVDANGIERVVVPPGTDWVPAPMEATDEQKEHLEKVNKVFDKARETRTAALSGNKVPDIKNADRQVNDPGQGGSQTAALTVETRKG